MQVSSAELTCRVEEAGFHFMRDPGWDFHAGTNLVESVKKNTLSITIGSIIKKDIIVN